MKKLLPALLFTLPLTVILEGYAGTNSWTPVAIGPSGTYVTVVQFDKHNPLVGYAGAYNNGLSKTTNGGVDWFSVGPQLLAPHPSVSVTDVVLDPSNSDTLYGFAFGWPASFTNTVFKSPDGGSNWIAAAKGLPQFDNNLQPSPIAIDPNNPNTLLVEAHVTIGPSAPTRLFKSVDAGTNWTEINTTGLTVRRIYGLAFDPFVPLRLYAVGFDDLSGGFYVSTNSGADWSKTGLDGLSSLVVRTDKTHPGTVFVGSNGGPYKSTDSGMTWISTPTSSQQCLTISIDDYVPDVIFSGGNDGVFRSTDRGSSYVLLATLPGTAGGADPLEFEPATKTIFAGQIGSLYSWTIVEPPSITINSAFIVKCPTQKGFSYQLQESTNFIGWTNTGISKIGDGFIQNFTNSNTATTKIYRVNVH